MSTVSGYVAGQISPANRGADSAARRSDQAASAPRKGESRGDSVRVSMSDRAAAMMESRQRVIEENRQAARSVARIAELAAERAPPPAEGTLRFQVGLVR